MNIDVLATGSTGNAYTIFDGETRLLLECGIPWRKLQEKTGFSMGSVTACLITHEHKDHCKAVNEVIKNGIDVYCSRGTASSLNIKSHRIRVMPIMEDFTVGSFVIRAFDVVHDCTEPVGFLIRSTKTGEILMFATDTAYIKYKFLGLTHIMIEANYDYGLMSTDNIALNKRVMHSHMSLDSLKDWLFKNDLSRVKQIYLLHLSEERSNEAEFLRVAQMLSGVEVYVA